MRFSYNPPVSITRTKAGNFQFDGANGKTVLPFLHTQDDGHRRLTRSPSAKVTACMDFPPVSYSADLHLFHLVFFQLDGINGIRPILMQWYGHLFGYGARFP
jgi:hypothetical protein